MSDLAAAVDLDAVRRDPYYRRFRAVVQAIGRDIYQGLPDQQATEAREDSATPAGTRPLGDIANAA